MTYSLQQLTADIETAGAKPRIFDTFLLPPFLCWYAVRSKEMRKNLRRILFSAGVWMFYRNYTEYRKALTTVQEAL